MKKLLSLMLALALICGIGLAGAENEHINRFLISVFDHLGGVDLNRQALTFTLTDSGSTVNASVQRRGSLTHVEFQDDGESFVVEFNDDALWYLDKQSGEGGWLRFEEIEDIARSAMSMIGMAADLMDIMGMGSSVDIDLDLDYENLLASISDFVSMLFSRGLESNTARGPYEVGFRLTQRDLDEVTFQWMDRIFTTPAYLDAWYGVVKSLIGTITSLIPGGELFDLGTDLFDMSDVMDLVLDLGVAASKEEMARDWQNKKDEYHREMLRNTSDRILLDATVTLSPAGDFVSLRVRDDSDPNVLNIAYDGRDLMITGSSVSEEVRISAETDSELIISHYDSSYGRYREDGRLRLTEGPEWRLETIDTSASGYQSVAFSVSVQSGRTFTPLSEDSRVLHLTDELKKSFPGLSDLSDLSDLTDLFDSSDFTDLFDSGFDFGW